MDTAQALADDRGGTAFEESLTWVRAIHTTLAEHSLGNQDVSGVLARLAERAGNLATNAEWTFLFDLSRKLKVTSLVVSHDMACALKIADRILVLDQAGILALDTVKEIKRSKEPLIREFLEETLALLPPEERT
jgi:hypothetical protein